MTDTPITLRVSDIVRWPMCPRAWYLDKNWSSQRFRAPFFVGTGVHAGLEAYYRNNRSADAAVFAVDAWAAEQEATFEEQFVQTWQEANGEEHVDSIVAMVDHYCMFDRENHLQGDIAEDDDGPIIERRMTQPILGHDFEPMLDSQGRQIMLSGQCDLGLDRDGNSWIVDHKTFSLVTIQKERPEAAMEVDEQLTAYCYLWWRTYGEIPKGVIYNVLIKSVPEPPRLLKNGTLSMAKDQKTTGTLFRQAIKDHGLKIAPYLNHIAWLDQQGYTQYFQRWQASRNIHELREFERKLALKVKDMLRVIEQPEVYAHSAGSTYRCGHCEWISPCKSYDDGGDGDAVLESSFYQKEPWAIT
jgi:hypothetical protein